MKEKYSKKQLEEIYNCEINKELGVDNQLYWVAKGLPIKEAKGSLFARADGLTLDELHKNIREITLCRLTQKEVYQWVMG